MLLSQLTEIWIWTGGVLKFELASAGGELWTGGVPELELETAGGELKRDRAFDDLESSSLGRLAPLRRPTFCKTV